MNSNLNDIARIETIFSEDIVMEIGNPFAIKFNLDGRIKFTCLILSYTLSKLNC